MVVVTRNRLEALARAAYPAEWLEADLTLGPLAPEAIDGIDAVIHLMGENIADGPWTPARKDRMRRSRIDSTRNLISGFYKKLPPIFLSASAVGIYGDRGEELLTEDASPGEGFLANLCKDWEAEVLKAGENSREARLRFGLVLSPWGGVAARLIPLFQDGLVGRLGSGRQWVSWIHIDDLVQFIMKALVREEMSGPINFASPDPVRNSDWTRGFVNELRPWASVPVPAPVLRMTLGEMATALLGSQKVSPSKLRSFGLAFQWENFDQAIHQVCNPFQNGKTTLRFERYYALRPEILQTLFSGESFGRMKAPVPYIRDWEHLSRIETLGPGTLLIDYFSFRIPLGMAGRRLAGPLIEARVRYLLAFRHQRILATMKI